MKIAFTGGGTLGHVYPALSVIEDLKTIDDKIDIFYISTKKDNEIKLLKFMDIRLYPISSGKLRRYFSFENLVDFFKVIKGYFDARKILKKEKPDLLFSKGGYLSVPVVLAAYRQKIKIITHESDTTMGLANRINSRFAEKVLLGFKLPCVDDKKYFYTGNPIRKAIKEAIFEKKEGKPLLLALGGSQGALEINELIKDNLTHLLDMCDVYHQTGPSWDEKIEMEGYQSKEFYFDELGSLLKKASLVVSRAGAGAISEAMYCKIPMVLLPLRKASRGDQVVNARLIEELGVGFCLDNRADFLPLVERILYNEECGNEIAKSYQKFENFDSNSLIVSHILSK